MTNHPVYRTFLWANFTGRVNYVHNDINILKRFAYFIGETSCKRATTVFKYPWCIHKNSLAFRHIHNPMDNVACHLGAKRGGGNFCANERIEKGRFTHVTATD